jgi:hypothetical protein
MGRPGRCFGSRRDREGTGHALLLSRGQPMRLGKGLMFSAQLEYDVVKLDNPPPEVEGPWKVGTRGYRYHLMIEDLCEVLVWHWPPDGNSTYTDPHLHVGRTHPTLSRSSIE